MSFPGGVRPAPSSFDFRQLYEDCNTALAQQYWLQCPVLRPRLTSDGGHRVLEHKTPHRTPRFPVVRLYYLFFLARLRAPLAHCYRLPPFPRPAAADSHPFITCHISKPISQRPDMRSAAVNGTWSYSLFPLRVTITSLSTHARSIYNANTRHETRSCRCHYRCSGRCQRLLLLMSLSPSKLPRR
jgi:hypothetical protein